MQAYDKDEESSTSRNTSLSEASQPSSISRSARDVRSQVEQSGRDRRRRRSRRRLMEVKAVRVLGLKWPPAWRSSLVCKTLHLYDLSCMSRCDCLWL